MNKVITGLCALALVAGPASRAEEEPKIVAQPLHIGGLQEFGYVTKGLYKAGTENALEANMDWVDHFGVFLSKEVTVEDRLHLSAGLGGVFQFRKPETRGLGFNFHQRKAFFIGPNQAQATFDVGEVGHPWLTLTTGMFGYKYNPQAYNLGEYLFRSGAYPTYQVTGGYVIANSAGTALEGFKAGFDLGDLKADLLLFTETGLAPLYDWSLAAVASYSIADGLLDVGAGFNWQRLLQVRPSRTARKDLANSWFQVGDNKYAGMKEFYSSPESFYSNRADTLAARDSAANAVAITRYRALAADYRLKAQVVDSMLALDDSLRTGLHPYSGSGVLLMARATLDPKKLIGAGPFGPEDLKVYAEIDVLGVENYPIYYENLADRVPVMFGLNLPGFRFFDLIAVQGEYMHSPWLNNTYARGKYGYNVPYLPSPADKVLSRTEYNDLAEDDDLKWTLQVKKALGKNVSLWLQVANDHLRLTSSSYYYGPQFDHNEITAGKDNMYWMAQVSWGL